MNINQQPQQGKTTTMKPVLVTTAHRGVFAGLVDDDFAADPKPDTVTLQQARMAIYFGTTKGVLELADTGPTSNSRIGAPADITLYDITSVADITDKAWLAWQQ